MAPKKSETSTSGEGPAADGDIVVTPNELKLIMSVLRSSTRSGKPWLGGTVNWDAVSVELKLKSGKTAKDRMCQVTKKFGLFEAEDPAAADNAAAPPVKGAKGAATDDKAPKAKKAAAAPKLKGKGKGKRPADDDDAAGDGTPGDDDQGNDDHGDGGDGDVDEVKKEDAKKKRTKKVKVTKSE